MSTDVNMFLENILQYEIYMENEDYYLDIIDNKKEKDNVTKHKILEVSKEQKILKLSNETGTVMSFHIV